MVNNNPVVGARGALAIMIQGVAVAGHLIGGYLGKQFDVNFTSLYPLDKAATVPC